MNLIFDLDGTLIDSAPDIHATANEVLATESLGALSLAQVRSFIGRGVPHLVDRLLGAHGAADPQRAARMVAEFGRRYIDAVHLTQPYPNVPDALDSLRADGHTLAICTNKPVAATRAVLAHLGLDQHFGIVIGGDSLPQRKPDPAPLLLARNACGDGDTLFIGDSEIDAECAQAAGIPMILHLHGYRLAEAASLPHAALMDDFAQLPGLVAQLARR